jgi:hypothetical protein
MTATMRAMPGVMNGAAAPAARAELAAGLGAAFAAAPVDARILAIAIVVATLAAPFTAAQAQGTPKELSHLVGKPLSSVRSTLLAGGWEPQETALTTARGQPERSRGEAGRLLEAGYPEVERCTGSSKNYCFFNYRRGGKCLRVRTLGVLAQPDLEPKVHGVGDACPSKQTRR